MTLSVTMTKEHERALGWLKNPAAVALATHQQQLDADGIMVGVSRQAIDETLKLASELVGALNFILAFYEPGQRYLDTEAWKCAEAGARRVMAKAKGEDAA